MIRHAALKIMASHDSALDRFASDVHPDALRDVLSWAQDAELSGLLAKLRSHEERKSFFDAWAEAMVARHLRAAGCDLRFEVPTPSDRRADFEVHRDGLKFFLHIKRVDAARPSHRHLLVSSRLRVLEHIRRPYVVQVRWHERLGDDAMQMLVHQAEEFILRGRVGDEKRVIDADGREIGGVRIIAPHDGDRVSLTIGLPSGFIDLSPRMRRLLQRAHEQFMPRSVNVVMLASDHDDDVIDFEAALLGSHIERWDQFPPRGKRIAHGRAADGFWHSRRFSDSAYATCMRFVPREDAFRSRLYVRNSLRPPQDITMLLRSLFDHQRR